MNILYAVHGYKPAYRIGGPVISVSAAAETLAKKGHRVTVFTTSSNLDTELDVPFNQPIDVDGVEVWYFRREEPLQKWLPFVPYLSRSMGFLYCPAMKGELERVMPRIDVVDTHMPFVYPSYAAAHAAFRHRRPLFYHQRGNFDPGRLAFRGRKKRLYISLVEKPIMRRATRLIALTEAERASFRALGIDTPCEVVPNGIDLPAARPGAAERVEQKWGVAPDAQLLLFLGRLHPQKGAETLLDAFARAQPAVPKAVLMMAGPDEWRLETSWRARVAGGGLADRVLFPGMLTGDDKADVLARADLFCLPSLGEGFSMAVLEALAASTAVMLSPGCHFPEVEPDAGMVVDAHPQRMSDAMVQMLADPVRLKAMGDAGRKLTAERYTWDAVADRLIEVYESGR
jgi:glycosyltransferase involved in cell wall biosynthesis